MFYKTYKNIDKALINPKKVKKLYIQLPQKDLNEYEGEFLKFKNLKSLDIHVAITHSPLLPKEIGQLKKLTRLSILNVPFEKFPDWIKDLENLKYLMVRGCDLNQIPEFIGNLQKLRHLRVENCELSSIPKELSKLKKIRHLSFADTKIPDFPLENLPPNIKTLALSGPIFRYTAEGLCRLRKALPKVKIYSFMKVDCQ